MRAHRVVFAVLHLLLATGLDAQTRSMAQDSSLDNLRHPAGTAVTVQGTARITRQGEGSRAMILIPGLGFGDDIWSEFIDRNRSRYTMHAVTLPGFGDTPPLAIPPEGSRFADLAWTRSTTEAIEALMERERMDRVTLVAHWALASQIALRLALDHPDRVDAVVLVGGPLKSYFDGPSDMMAWTPEQRIAYAEGLGQRWFRTVTRQTWDDNNFMPWDYATNPLRGLFLWRQAQAPLLSVWVRYLLEFYSIDMTADLGKLRVPALVVQPDFDNADYFVDSANNYMRNLTVDSWRDVRRTNNRFEFVTVPKSRLFIMHDQPETLDRLIDDFLRRTDRTGRDTN